jgi:hypothetical protein
MAHGIAPSQLLVIPAQAGTQWRKVMFVELRQQAFGLSQKS